MSRLAVDTSAAMAILTGETGANVLLDALDQAAERLMSTATVVELGIVLEARLGPAGRGVADRFVRDAEITLVDVTRQEADVAVDGWRRYGKGRHRAALNFGDCFTYALAVTTQSSVLCVGDDFTATDIGTVSPT